MLTKIVAMAFSLLLVPMGAAAASLDDIVALSKAGLSDAVLEALIDADHSVFTLDANQILNIRAAGVSEAVILKMISSRPPNDFDPFLPETPASMTTVGVPVFVPFAVGAVPLSSDRIRRRSTSPVEKGGDIRVTPRGGFSTGLRIRNGEFVR